MKTDSLLRHFKESSAFFGANADFIEELYEQFLQEPESVGDTWRKKFQALQNGGDLRLETPHGPIKDRFLRLAETPSLVRPAAVQRAPDHELLQKQSSVTRLINQYRVSGHQQANNDPLNLHPRLPVPDLDPLYYGLSDLDMETVFDTGTLYGAERLPLREIISLLKETYCGTTGFEYSHIVDIGINSWITNRIEGTRGRIAVSNEQKAWLLTLLTAAEGIEKYLH